MPPAPKNGSAANAWRSERNARPREVWRAIVPKNLMADDTTRRLLAVAGQLQTLLFQIELLKRCDPEVLVKRALRAKIKHNALMVLYLHSRLAGDLAAQAAHRLTVGIYCLWMWLRRACSEAAALANEIDTYATYRDKDRFFSATMNLSPGGTCRLHSLVGLSLYGRTQDVTRELGLINDAENLLKQINYCHLIVSTESAEAALVGVDEFLTATVGGGMVASPETYDHTQPCCICLDELSVTANQGDTIYKRLGYSVCDHLVKQVKVNVTPDDVLRHMPFLNSVDANTLRGAIDKLRGSSGGEVGGGRRLAGVVPTGCRAEVGRSEQEDGAPAGDDRADLEHEARASRILDSYDVFTEAPGPVYRLSELRYWLASGKAAGAKTRGSCAHATHQATVLQKLDTDLSAMFARAETFERECRSAEREIFGTSFAHFHRHVASKIASVRGVGGGGEALIDKLLAGSPATAPEAEIETLISSCYSHHMSLPLFSRLGNPEKADTDALVEILKSYRDQTRPRADKAGGRAEDGAGDCDDEGYPGAADATRRGQRDWIGRVRVDTAAVADEHEDKVKKLLDRAERDLTTRRKNYAERLSARSFSNLDRCVKNQRAELEKLLRVNVYGAALPAMYVELKNGFLARQAFMKAVTSDESQHIRRCRLAREDVEGYEQHQYVRSALMRTSLDPAALPHLASRFYELVSGPMFRRHVERFPQPPNTSLYFTVENVGLLPHLKEELASFTRTYAHAEWMVSEFREFYDFSGISGVSETQRAAYAYIREAVFAAALFESIFQCGRAKLMRADSVEVDAGGPLLTDGIYLTFEERFPLIAIWGVGEDRRLCATSVVVTEKDLYAVLYAVLHKQDK
ncbi:ICP18.5 [Psittacid alphaherpesvirus 1]|uniref:Tripartite terminase subunit 1 n=1 Tax=Psittacid herpesvirus 1 (isolate Amazon parrot/-/97-0001/1997) TaxID=670426 RepID=TRM1_PSHV1|nr:DNA packaging terminase subunit 2 [Psittacid alphaherpesvirus 1]Q6UDK3.1 RecName: Full=Tripartite terminase subunit 1 [Psittacid herpesvirus 1 Amazon parrot/1997]AAQ73707.1 ICP18.5 [Psittacid alphaherpesvirus 1]